MSLWSSIKKTVKHVGDVTGVDRAITSIPGSGTDAANAAKIAAIAAGGYYAYPYLVGAGGAGTGSMGAFGSGGIGSGAWGGAGEAALGAGSSGTGSGIMGALGTAGNILNGAQGLSNIFGAGGVAVGSGKERQGYINARDYAAQLGQASETAHSYADPFSQYRGGMAARLNSFVTDPNAFKADPGYQFALNEGQQQVERGMAAKGMTNSGNVLAELQQRGQDIASQQYSGIIDRLTNLAGGGSNSAAAGADIYGRLQDSSLTGQATASIGAGNASGRQSAAGASGIGSFLQNAGSIVDAGKTIAGFFS